MPDTDIPSYRGRFAPSPSGKLHFGSLVAAVASYLDARAVNGQWLVRIENLDPPREVPGAADEILCTLEAFGFEWDEEVRYQGQRFPQYLEIVETLVARGTAYPCSCSRKTIAATSPMGIEGPIYPGTCRHGMADCHAKSHSIRLLTRDEPIAFRDLIQGESQQRLASVMGDFVIRRVEGYPAYQLAVAVDDAEQGITRVVRGFDLFHSTARQIYLQGLLEYPQPEYAHIPLAVDRQGQKLSKQLASLPLNPTEPLPALRQALLFLGQPLPPQEIFLPEDFWRHAIEHWDIRQVPRCSQIPFD